MKTRYILKPTFNSNDIPEMVRVPVKEKTGLWPVLLAVVGFWGLVAAVVWWAAIEIL